MKQPEHQSEPANQPTAPTGLSAYVPLQKSNYAHLVRHFPETDEIYMFCTRYMGKPVGSLYTLDQYDDLPYARPICPKCKTAIEASLERFGVLQGMRPDQIKTAAAKMGDS